MSRRLPPLLKRIMIYIVGTYVLLCLAVFFLQKHLVERQRRLRRESAQDDQSSVVNQVVFKAHFF